VAEANLRARQAAHEAEARDRSIEFLLDRWGIVQTVPDTSLVTFSDLGLINFELTA